MSEEKKGNAVFSFIWKCMITLAMFYGIAYGLGYDQALLNYIHNTVVPEMGNTLAPMADKAKVLAGEAADLAMEKGREAVEKGKSAAMEAVDKGRAAAKEAAKNLGNKAKAAVDKAKTDISNKIGNRI